MDKNKGKKKTSIAETFSIFLIIMLCAGYFYWRIFGFPLIDDQIKYWVDSNYLLSGIISLLAFGILLSVSYFNFKKGNNFELFKLFFYGAIAFIAIISFIAGLI